MAKATEACKEKDASTFTLQRSVAPKWKEDKTAFWSAEEFWKLSNGKKFSRGYILEATPFVEQSVVVQLRDDVGASTILWEIFIDYTVHQQRENNLKLALGCFCVYAIRFPVACWFSKQLEFPNARNSWGWYLGYVRAYVTEQGPEGLWLLSVPRSSSIMPLVYEAARRVKLEGVYEHFENMSTKELSVRISISYVSPSSTWEGSTRRFDLTPRVQARSNSHQLRELLDSIPDLGCVNNFFNASVRKATDIEFYVFMLGRDLVFHFGFDSLTMRFCTPLMNVLLSSSDQLLKCLRLNALKHLIAPTAEYSND
ncbi:myelin transcription factor 1-like [Dorcoceras hygrometricum]|uniref:Myelin transcription factor 1-like n=1 Tax=Dorcoceras hygrometricum TaxID=472368 RepID=A0A2Z7B9G3_9LAMI|nr:myelin transcription factor 1-like [Dorcoceras hygrometricum]